MKKIILLLVLQFTILMGVDFVITKDGLRTTASEVQSPASTPEVQPPVSTPEVQPPVSTPDPVSAPATYTLPPATHWVDGTNGNDSNNGTSNAAAWKTIQKAANSLAAGDTVYIKGGTYYENVTINVSGVPGNEITFAAAPGETVIVDGNNVTPQWSGIIHISANNYIRISGLRVQNNAKVTGATGIQVMTGADHVTIDNCYIYNTSSCGIYAYGYGADVTNLVIDNNKVEYANQGTYTSFNGASSESISMCKVNGYVISNTEVFHGNKEGIDTKCNSTNGKIHNNYVHDFPRVHPSSTASLYTGSMGIYVDSGTNIEISNNHVENCNGGVHIASEGGVAVNNIHIHHNLVDGGPSQGVNAGSIAPNGVAFVGGYGGDERKIDINIENNIFIALVPLTSSVAGDQFTNLTYVNNINIGNAGYPAFYFKSGTPSSITMDRNLIYGDNGAASIYGTNRVNADPQFVDESEYRLDAGSPAIGTGKDPVATTDYEGDTIVQGSTGSGYDIGLYNTP